MTTPLPIEPGREAGRRLGSLLVEQGLLTPAQLEQALAEQRSSGLPLGQALVRLGLASPGGVAQALATQQGGLAKTEYGMAVGFGTTLPEPPVSAPPLTAVDEPTAAELRERLRGAEARLDAMAEQMVKAARRIAELQVERDSALAQLAGRRA